MKRWLGFSCVGCVVGLVFACSGTSNEGDDSAGAGGTGAMSSGGASTGGASSGGTTSGGASSGGTSTGGAPSGGSGGLGGDGSGGNGLGGETAWGACAAEERGTSVAEGTCNVVNDFEGDADTFGSLYELDSDGRRGAGIDVDGPTGLPRLSGGANASGMGELEIVEDGNNSFIRFKFADAEEWGGTFAHMISNDSCYDASVYTGVRFRARASESENMKFAVATADSQPLYDCAPEEDCYNAATTTVAIGGQWQNVEIFWHDLLRPDWGQDKNEEIDPTRILAFIFGDAGEDEFNTIELDIDDIEFMGGDASSCEFASGAGGAGGADSSD